jgi:hypothetical protein
VLTFDEKGRVEEELALAVARQGDYQTVVTTIFSTESGAMLRAMPVNGQTPDSVAIYVLAYCLLNHRAHKPPLLEMLLDYLVNTKGIGNFQVQLDRVRQGIDPNPDEYSSAWLGDRPFFDRFPLRAGVRQLIEDNARPILLVSPAPDSYGRTYSRYFLQHLEDRLPSTVRVVYVQIGPDNGPTTSIDDLLTEVQSQVPRAEALPSQSSSDHPKTASRWLLRQLMNQPGRWLLVLDGFGQEALHPEVRATIEALAAILPTGQYRRQVRLVLLDYPQPLPGTTAADILFDALRPADQIGLSDIAPCLRAWNEQRRDAGLKVVPDTELVDIANDILGRVPPAGRARVERLNYELSGLHEYPGGAVQ